MADGPWMVDDLHRSPAQENSRTLSLPAPSDFERVDRNPPGPYYRGRQQDQTGTQRQQTPGAGSARSASADAGGERALRMVLIGIIVALVMTIVGVIVFQVAIAPRLKLERVVLNSNVAMTQEDLLKAAGIASNALYYSLDPAGIEKRLMQVPMVREAHVEMQFPNAVAIRLVSREPLASALVRTEAGVQVPVLIDSMGVAYEIGLSTAAEGLPVLSGIEFKNFYPGLALPKFIVPFLQDLENLRLKAPALYRGFSEFKLVPVGPQEIEVLAYSMQSSVPVRINPRLSEESALYLLRSLEVLNRTTSPGTVREIDFRTNSVVYKTSTHEEGAK